jgi:tetratricopeptide (TPR) repeat protein
LGKLGRYEEALNIFEKAGDRAAVYNNLGCIYMEHDRYREAEVAFKKAIEINPSFYEKANRNLEMARAAQHHDIEAQN